MSRHFLIGPLLALILGLTPLPNAAVYGQDFMLDVTVQSSSGLDQILTIGLQGTCTNGLDALCDEVTPPLPPPGLFGALLTFEDHIYRKDIRAPNIRATFTMRYQAETGEQLSLSWNPAGLAALGTFHIVDDITGSLFGPFDMTTASSLDISAEPTLAQGLRILFTSNTGVDVGLKVFLQGAYSGSTMRTGLNDLLPLSHPYGSAPWNYAGLETVSSFAPDIVDWVLVELRTSTEASSTVATRAALLKSDGMVVDTDSSSPVAFPGIDAGDYYVVVRHRNHLSVMSAVPVSLAQAASKTSATDYDFTISNTQAFGNEMMDLDGGVWGMYGGDSNADGQVVYIGSNRDQLAIISLLGISNLADLVGSVYNPADLTLDSNVAFIGGARDQVVIINALGISNLAGTRQSQVPD